jgi:hypothetical protein
MAYCYCTMRVLIAITLLSLTQGFGFASVLNPQCLQLRTPLQLRGGGPFQFVSKLLGKDKDQTVMSAGSVPKIIIAGLAFSPISTRFHVWPLNTNECFAWNFKIHL